MWGLRGGDTSARARLLSVFLSFFLLSFFLSSSALPVGGAGGSARPKGGRGEEAQQRPARAAPGSLRPGCVSPWVAGARGYLRGGGDGWGLRGGDLARPWDEGGRQTRAQS